MKLFLKILFAAILIAIVSVNLWAGLQINLFEAWPDYKQNPWAIATLYDAYLSFTIFYVWVAYREPTWIRRLIWFVLIMGLGSITMSLYVLIALARLRPDEPAWNILARRIA